MTNETPQNFRTQGELSRPSTTTHDSEFTLSIDEALALYERAGLPRTPRSVQRYCAKGHLQARLIETPSGEKYLISPSSLEKHIAYIKEVSPQTGRVESRPVATSPVAEIPSGAEEHGAPTSSDKPRLVVTETPDVSRFVTRLESENEFLRGQIDVKDSQIKDLTERARETNHLIGGLQKMLSPLLGRPTNEEPNPITKWSGRDDQPTSHA